MDRSSETDVVAAATHVVVVFAAVGVGVGVSGFVAMTQFVGVEFELLGFLDVDVRGLLALVAFGVSLFGGPFLAVTTSDRFATGSGDVAVETYYATFLAHAVGHVLLAVLASLLLSLGAGESSGAPGLDHLLVPVLLVSIPTGVVAVAVVWSRSR